MIDSPRLGAYNQRTRQLQFVDTFIHVRVAWRFISAKL